MNKQLLLLNGPNLNLLGTREPDVYGTATLADVEELVSHTAETAGFTVRALQSNHEGVLIDTIHAARNDCAGIVINPAGFTHTSIALRDALAAVNLPVAEVHISDISTREQFRQFSYVRDIARVHVSGQGVAGYQRAVEQLIAVISEASTSSSS